ncbi:MAG: hypothetical protein AAF098_08940 [Pseudomonadota bacterium]
MASSSVDSRHGDSWTQRGVPALWVMAGALVYLSCGYTEMMGSDLWWHIAGGREIVQAASPILTDRWSYTEFGERWHNHEWLADLLFYAWTRAFGLYSLVYWKWLLIIATFSLLQRCLARTSRSDAGAFLASITAVLLAAPFLDLRPQLYTLLGTTVLLTLAYQRTPKLWQLMLLFAVWVNLHGGFVFGLMLLGVLLFPRQTLSTAALRQYLIHLAIVAACCLLNPSGIQVFLLPLSYALDSASPYRTLAEWRPPFEVGGIVSPFYAYSLVVGAALMAFSVLPFVRRHIRCSWDALAIASIAAAMSLTSRRFIVLWAIAFALLLAPFAARFFRLELARWILPVLLVGVIGAGVLRQAPYPIRADIAFHYLTAEYAYPHAIARYISQNQLSGKTFAYYNWGGFLHWQTNGAMRVFIDGRANTLYDDQTYELYRSVLSGGSGWVAIVESSGAEYFLWPWTRGGDRLQKELLATGRWTRIYQESRGALLVRNDVALPSVLSVPNGFVSTELADAFQASRRNDIQASLSAAKRAHELKPWNKDSCSWLKRAFQLNGQQDEAARLIEECKDYFPTKFF